MEVRAQRELYMNKYFSEFSAQDITHLPNLPREDASFVSSSN